MDRVTAPSPAAPRRRGEAARAVLRWVPVFCALIVGPACALNQQGVDPPADTFFYPTGAIADPQSNWLFVTNSNADLRYNDGTLVVADLNAAASDRALGAGAPAWELCPQEDYVNPLPRSDPQICCWDRLDANILNCDERRYVQPASTVRIGSFAAGMVWQDYCPDPCNPTCVQPTVPEGQVLAQQPLAGRLLIGVRGDTSLTWADVTAGSPPSIACGQSANVSLAECGGDHREVETTSALVTESKDTSAPLVNLPDEPYALQIDPAHGLLYVGHLVGSTATVDTGGVSLFDVSGTGVSNAKPPKFISPFPSPFPPNSAGFYGITALQLHAPFGQLSTAPKEVFASSRYVPLVTGMVPFGSLPPVSDPADLPKVCPISASDVVIEPAGDTFNSGLFGSEMRGVEFIEPTTSPPTPAARAYALERVPPDLVGFNLAANQAGSTIATPTDVSETCSSPTFLYQHKVTDAEGTRLYVNCFDTGEVYIFDPSVPTILTTLQVGRGPAGIMFDGLRPVAYVIGFSDNNISVLDLAPGSPTQYHVIQRLGFPSVTPR
jgi:hypothetical protein